ncbi:hypothetical protein GCM10010124_14990 [Pilimelia terevasa]|uniref:Nitrate reductase molybdenum cofactor assembly chaperone n=1 Tax=Pilimelia terevasa TaxID=53372 RepID=A0A8J3BN64_9ACTN|nr:nitrate reductase molybdenum cofactor assembly chaperone [Pilimelia terevasa]GGK23516.1 hypothetical protein GCM10010124_14990 [Pilimelia terevasa]
MSEDWRPVAARAASLLLRYPDPETLAAVPLVEAALPALPAAVADPLRELARYRAGGDPITLAGEYVEWFDFRRRSALHLTYYTCGDTRGRGAALVAFAAAYRAAGRAVADGELPDFLPAVLDLAAVDARGWRLLRAHRVGLDLLARALADVPYAHGVAAVRAMLPPAGAADVAAAVRLARTGPPAERVGLGDAGLVDSTGTRR